MLRPALPFVFIATSAFCSFGQTTPSPTRAQVLPLMEKMADAQLAAFNNNPPADWIAGAFYVGLASLTHVSNNPKYLEAELKIADKYQWSFKTGGGASSNIAHADNECIAQMYIDAAVTSKDVGKLEAIKKQWSEVIANYDDPAHRRDWANDPARDGSTLPWWWCDALFMAPAGLTRLSEVTWDRRYIDAMDKQWWTTTEKLYDKDEHLFYRDNRFLTQKTPNGKKVFWGRGNGWVYAGLANVLTYMPIDYPTRPKYVRMYQDMSDALLQWQQADGLWRGSIIDPASANVPETSGTAFFTYGFAWGINHGLLERSKFEPAVDKGWAGMTARIKPDGLIGWVQAVGDSPASADANSTKPYAVGGFLLAGTEIIRMREHE